MSLKRYGASTQSFLRCLAISLLAAMASASLTGCGTISSDAMAWAEAAKEQEKAAEVAKAVPSKADSTPDVPENLARCVVKDPKPGATADQYVANMALTLDERKACAKALLAWYRSIQAANKKTAAATAPAKKATVTK